MSKSIGDREARLVKRFPALRAVPEGQRHALAMRAARQRSVWWPLMAMFFVVLPALAMGIIFLQAHLDRTTLAIVGGLIGGIAIATVVQVIHYVHGKAIHRLVSQ
ncbi:hypothetical protein QTI66_11080 [Variovorax sp. J22R133]|uniref:hypothetical protein n=1 Tax=Variovorax brevis TaxID=3053503 RepID=UPI0025761FDB|nr:hypothetical protein [Variovorax sp. J22R133]MDM0112693.1 hypothetical protein [Variovorax sp. J22R133]